MSLLPSLRIEFDKALNKQQRLDAVEKVRAIKGVLSVGYHEQGGVVGVTYAGGQDVVSQVRAIPGLKVDARHRF